MYLDNRKERILQAIVDYYVNRAEPIASKIIANEYGLDLSSATIRNEMADLEDLGYIMQPHTSAGRIPSDKGYRLYVDLLMEEKEQEVIEMREAMLEKADKMDKILKQAAKVLAANTNYATMISAPTYNRNKLNRFVSNRHIYEHNDVVLSFVAKISFDDHSEEMMIMVPIEPNDNIETISKKI